MAKRVKTKDIVRADGWENLLTKVGVEDRDKRLSSTVASALTFQVRHELDDLYHGNDLANRICNLPAVEMTRNWVDFQVDDEEGETDSPDSEVDEAEREYARSDAFPPADDKADPLATKNPPISSKPKSTVDPQKKAAVVADVMEALDTLKAKARFTEALQWARLFGGAAIWVGANDGGAPDKPLKLEKVKSVDWLTVYDRHELRIFSYVEDPLAPDFGMPELYEIITAPGKSALSYGKKIHASRILHFDGSPTTRYRRRAVNNGWGDSIFVKLLRIVRDYDGVWDSASVLMQDFAQAVYKMKGLAEAMAANGEKAVMDRLELLDVSRSVLRAMVIDADNEEFERKQTPLTGMPELMDRWLHRVSAAAEVPITLLFGMSPGGLNATGESDTRFWYDHIKAKQEAELRDPLEKLLTILLNAKEGPTGGKEPEGWSFYFCPLWQMTDKEKADVRKTVADTDAIYYDRQILSADEIAFNRWATGEYSIETKLDLEARAAMAEAVEAGEVTPALQPGEAPKDIRGMSPEAKAEQEAKAKAEALKAKGKPRTDSKKKGKVVFKRDPDGRIASAEIEPEEV